jgi:putative sigma-54 modulation protein
MKLILSMHNLKRTRAIENHVIKCIEKLDHKDRWAINARVTLEFDKTKVPERQFKCAIRLTVPGPDLYAVDVEGDMYAAIDLVTKKIEGQIRKRHSKHKARKHSQAARVKLKRQDDA